MKKHLVTLLAVALLGGCAMFTVHPKPLPKGAVACHSDVDCTDGQHCGFPGVDTYAQCIGGAGDQSPASIDGPPVSE